MLGGTAGRTFCVQSQLARGGSAHLAPRRRDGSEVLGSLISPLSKYVIPEEMSGPRQASKVQAFLVLPQNLWVISGGRSPECLATRGFFRPRQRLRYR